MDLYSPPIMEDAVCCGALVIGYAGAMAVVYGIHAIFATGMAIKYALESDDV